MAEGEQGAGEGDVGDALGAALQKLAKERSEDERRAWETTKSLMDASRPEVSWETFAHPLTSESLRQVDLVQTLQVSSG